MAALKHKVMNSDGKEVGTIDLDPEVFGVEGYEDLVHMAVRWQRSAKRAGTHSTLTKGMMKGGNRKPWKQKGTGRARQGSNTSPLWVGGGTAHGPHPHSYRFRFDKRSRREALAAVLSDKVRNGKLVVLDKLAAPAKTKEMAAVLRNIGVSRGAVIVTPEVNDGVVRSSRNIPRVKTLPVCGVNVYDLVNAGFLVGTRESIEGLTKRVKAARIPEVEAR